MNERGVRVLVLQTAAPKRRRDIEGGVMLISLMVGAAWVGTSLAGGAVWAAARWTRRSKHEEAAPGLEAEHVAA